MMLWILLLGVATGMRTMTAVAVLCWSARLGFLPVQGTWAFWMASTVSVVIFTALALGEYVGDVLPKTPRRTDWGPLVARLVFGSVACTAAMTVLMEPVAGGIVFGVIGALAGAFFGMKLRLYLAKLLGRDWPVGIAESALALTISILVAHQLNVPDIFDRVHAMVQPLM
jgi:uncharacterized membrane protein